MSRRISVAMLLGASVLLTACPPQREVCLRHDRDTGFIPRIRLDRLGLTDDQKAADPGYGPYRDGIDVGGLVGNELVSELAPTFAVSEKLLQSDCLWLAAGEDPGAPVDFLAATWEAVESLRTDHPSIDTANGAARLGHCFPRDPIEGLPFILCPGGDPNKDDAPSLEEYCEGSQDAARYRGSFPLINFINAPDTECVEIDPTIPALAPPESLHLGGAATYRFEAVAAPDAGGACPARVAQPAPPEDDWLHTGGLVANGTGRFSGPVGFVVAQNGCGSRDLLPAEGDASYRLVIPALDPSTPDIVKWLGPNVLTVPGRRTVRRAMERVAGTDVYAWQTEVLRRDGTDGGDGLRWHENWSPHTLVESVRVYKEDGGGRQPAAAEAPLRVFGDDGQSSPVWDCAERIDEGDATAFPIHLEDGSPDCDVRVENREGTTPTYPLEFLDIVPGVIEEPLRWEIETEGVAHGTELVYLEFELRTVTDGAMLRARDALHLGDLTIGEQGSGIVGVENVGANAVRIETLSLRGPAKAEFGFRPLGERVLLPLPYEAAPDPGGSGWLLSEVPGFGGEPTLFEAATVYGGPSVRFRPADHGGQTLALYGTDISFADGVPVLLDPAAQLTIAPVEPGGWFFAGRWAYRAASLPIELAPGERLEIAVSATPSASGSRVASLDVDYVQVSDPSVTGWVSTVLTARGIVGPMASILGAPVAVAAGGSRRVALESIGGQPLDRGTITLVGPDAAAFALKSEHAPSQIIAPGEAEIFTIRFDPAVLPPFDQPFTATLELATQVGTVTAPLIGRSPVATEPTLFMSSAQPVVPVYLDNLSGQPIGRWAVSLSGPDRTRFAPVPAPPPTATLEPRVNHLLTMVRFTPDCSAPLAGPSTATLTVDTDAGPIEIDLVGTTDPEACP